MAEISPAMEDYLETILLLNRQAGAIRVTDIASRMNVAKSSVHMALHTLSDKGLINQERYGTIQLTRKGKAAAEAVYARHNALIEFFVEIIGVTPETAERDACRVEHILSQESMERIIKLTDNKK